MKPLLFVFIILLAAERSKAVDPYHPPEDWEAYQKRIIEKREHEMPGWQRPVPGTSPAVAIQTLILPEFTVQNASLDVAFQTWQEACRARGVNVRFYLEAAVLINRPSITHSAQRETAARALSFLGNMGMVQIKLLEDQFLAGAGSLDPHEIQFRVWVLSDLAAQFLHLNKLKQAHTGWCAAEDSLVKAGAAFPRGSYADYQEQTRALVVINTSVTLNALSEWIEEMESRTVIQEFRDKGEIQMSGDSLAVRSQKLRTDNATKIARRLKDSKGRLVPFAANSKTWAESRGLITPAGSAAWLDLDSSTLWLRSRPDHLDSFVQQLQQEDTESRPSK
ncbi:MAG: hypothetical protein U1F81_01260 [Verrucomicrobiaceae bacterium]